MTAVTARTIASRGGVFIAGVLVKGVVVVTVAGVVTMSSQEFEFQPETGMAMVSSVRSAISCY